MKRILSMLLTVMVLLGPAFSARAEEDGAGAETSTFPEFSYEELTVGNPTRVEGFFFTDLWGNNTSDLDVR